MSDIVHPCNVRNEFILNKATRTANPPPMLLLLYLVVVSLQNDKEPRCVLILVPNPPKCHQLSPTIHVFSSSSVYNAVLDVPGRN